MMLPAEPPEICIRMFGGLHVQRKGRAVRVSSSRQAALLAFLALEPGKKHDRRDIAMRLWPDESPDVTLHRLSVHLSALSRTLTAELGILASDRHRIWLSIEGRLEVDCLEFQRLVRRSRESSDPDEQILALEQSIDLYRGPLLPRLDLPGINELRHHCATILAESLSQLSGLLAERDVPRAIELGEQAVRADQHSDAAHAHLIRLYAAVGQYGEARRQYWEMERILRQELYAVPPADLMDFVKGLPAEAPTEELPEPPLNSALPRLQDPRAGARRQSSRTRTGLRTAAALAAAMCLILLLSWRTTRSQQSPPDPDLQIRQILDLNARAGRKPASRFAATREIADRCIVVAEEAWSAWYGRDERAWVDKLHRIDPQLIASADWLLAHEPDRAVQLCGALTRYWQLRDQMDLAGDYLQRSLDRGSKLDSNNRARALVCRARTLLGGTGDPSNAIGLRVSREALAMYERTGDRWGHANALRHVGLFVHVIGPDAEALRIYARALAEFKALGDRRGEGMVMNNRSFVMRPGEPYQDDVITQARDQFETIGIFRELGNERETTDAFRMLMERTVNIEPRPQSLPILARFEAEAREQLRVHSATGTRSEMVFIWRALLDAAIKLDDKPAMVEGLGIFMQDALSRQDLRTSATLCGAYLAHESTLSQRPISDSDIRNAIRTQYRELLGEQTTEALMRRGRTVPLKQAARLALR